MNLTTTTRVLLVLSLGGLALYDIAPFQTAVDGDTVSEVIRDAGLSSPSVPWAVGFLMGHFFWPGRREVPHGVAIGFGALVAIIFHLLRDVLDVMPMIVLVGAGAWCGHLVWPLEQPEPPDHEGQRDESNEGSGPPGPRRDQPGS